MTLSERIELIEMAMDGVTPGLWYLCEFKRPNAYHVRSERRHWSIVSAMETEGCSTPSMDVPDAEARANAAYIAACSPDRMREILLAYRTLEDEVERLKLTRKHSRIAAAGLYDAFEGEKKRAQAAEAKLEAMEQDVAEKDAEIARLRKIIAECQWYWPGNDTSGDYCEGSAWEVVEANAARPGDVTEVKRGGVVEVMFCASLPAAEDSDSDDDFWVQEKTEDEARAKIEAENLRRARTLLNGGSDAQG
ncbi:hypothetical protein EV665_13144 [Shinella granuli]|uniref:Ead/Ea22-like family protein n=2 Tax=Shinella granuli TaxID=323621 RepID=A0A4R2C536_SHIGR|nr:hypothetical protein [Shinella granuli]TCN34963.1 hypothetical protein EV665_13144 [Shinella granuli]